MIYYICSECAEEYGGKWRDDVSTIHIANCDCCEKLQALASVDDWTWPKGLPKDFSLAGGRD
jgi:hypothetical protein